MRTLLLLALTTSLSVAAAQTKAGVAALPTPDGALLRWSLPGDVIPARGFTLRLSGPEGTKTVQVASPQPYSAALGLSKAEYDAVTAIYRQPVSSDRERTQRAFFNLNVVARPAYARALGILTTVQGLAPGNYTVTVTALGAAETKVGAATFTTGPTPSVSQPGAPKAISTAAAVQLTWPASASAATQLVVAYNIYRAVRDGPFALIQPAPFFRSSQPGGDVFKDTDITAKSTYRYQVAAVDLFGRESARTAAVSVMTQTVSVIPAPENLQSAVKERAVTLRWIPAKDTRITKVVVLRGTDPTQPLGVLATLDAAAASYTDTTGLPGVPYVYAVAARDAAGQFGARSALVSARPVNTKPPAAPSGLSIKSGEAALTLSWKANREADLQGYQVYRSESKESGAPALLVNTAPITGTSFTDPLSAGLLNRYFYRVSALNTSEAESLRSDVASATLTDKTPPPVPKLLPATVSAQGVNLAWAQAEIPDLAGFRVLRASAGAAPAELKRLPAATRTYLDQTAEPGVTYRYSVQSVDAAGNTSSSSEPLSIKLRGAAPSAPQRVNVSRPEGKGGNTITWTATAGVSVVVYRLDKAGSPPLQLSGLLTTASFTDAQGTPDSQYQLRAVDERGQMSALTPPQPVAKP